MHHLLLDISCINNKIDEIPENVENGSILDNEVSQNDSILNYEEDVLPSNNYVSEEDSSSDFAP